MFHCCHRNLFACLWRHRHVKSKIYFWVAEKAYLLIFSKLCPNCCPNRDSWKTFDIGHHIWMSLKVICQVSSKNMFRSCFPRIRIALHKCFKWRMNIGHQVAWLWFGLSCAAIRLVHCRWFGYIVILKRYISLIFLVKTTTARTTEKTPITKLAKH